MKRLVSILGLLLCASPCWASWARVGTPTGATCTGTTTTCSVTYSPTAGNFLAVWWYQRNNGAVTSVTDNGSGGCAAGYTSAFNNAAGFPNESQALYYCCSSGTGVTSITGTATAESGHVAMFVAEYSGGATSSCLDTTTSSAATGTGTTATSGSTTATAGDLGLGLFGQSNDSTNTFAASGAGWSLVKNQAESQGGSFLGGTDNINMSGGSQTAVATITASVSWVAYISTFKVAAASGVFEDDSWQIPRPLAMDLTVSIWGLAFGLMLARLRLRHEADSVPLSGPIHCFRVVERPLPLAQIESPVITVVGRLVPQGEEDPFFTVPSRKN